MTHEEKVAVWNMLADRLAITGTTGGRDMLQFVHPPSARFLGYFDDPYRVKDLIMTGVRAILDDVAPSVPPLPDLTTEIDQRVEISGEEVRLLTKRAADGSMHYLTLDAKTPSSRDFREHIRVLYSAYLTEFVNDLLKGRAR